jgi:hypothetical protein
MSSDFEDRCFAIVTHPLVAEERAKSPRSRLFAARSQVDRSISDRSDRALVQMQMNSYNWSIGPKAKDKGSKPTNGTES